MKSNIFSLKKNSLGSYINAFIAYKDAFLERSNPLLTYTNSVIAPASQRKVYITDLDRDVTYAGTVDSLISAKGKVKVSLFNVQVFEYSTSSPLFDLPTISFSRPEKMLYIEEVNDFRDK